MKQCLACINFCHTNNIIHRDLKPENVLLEANKDFNAIKMIDFGEAIEWKSKSKITDRVGTAMYVAPEVIAKSYDSKCDIWSLGVMTFILVSGYPPFTGEDDHEILEKVKKGKYDFDDPAWEKVSDECKQFIRQLLTINPEKRPNAEQAINHPWI